jgi:hypothetical protein
MSFKVCSKISRPINTTYGLVLGYAYLNSLSYLHYLYPTGLGCLQKTSQQLYSLNKLAQDNSRKQFVYELLKADYVASRENKHKRYHRQSNDKQNLTWIYSKIWR